MAGVNDQSSMFARHDHAHLRLVTALPPENRRRRGGGGAGPSRFPHHAQHADDLAKQTDLIRIRHRVQQAVLGVDPELVIVLELNRPLDPDGLGPRELLVLDATDETAMVAFASDPDLTTFLHDLARYGLGPVEGRTSAPLESVFDAITAVREIRPADVIDADLLAELSQIDPEVVLPVR